MKFFMGILSKCLQPHQIVPNQYQQNLVAAMFQIAPSKSTLPYGSDDRVQPLTGFGKPFGSTIVQTVSDLSVMQEIYQILNLINGNPLLITYLDSYQLANSLNISAIQTLQDMSIGLTDVEAERIVKFCELNKITKIASVYIDVC